MGMKKIIVILGLVLVVSLYFTVFYMRENKAMLAIDSFVACVENGYPIMESYPRRCMTPDGRSFTEDLGQVSTSIPAGPINGPETGDDINERIVVTSPQAHALISSPVKIEGEARGFWFFEASFPARLLDANGKEIAVIPVTAKTDWMTEDFVGFYAELPFSGVTTATGTLILERDNPSGLPENDESISIPVKF